MAMQLSGAAQQGLTPSKQAVFAMQGQHELAHMMGAFGAWRQLVIERQQAQEKLMLAYKHLYFALARRCFDVLRSVRFFVFSAFGCSPCCTQQQVL